MKSTLKLVVLYWFPVLFYCLFIFIQSSGPAPEVLIDMAWNDKLMHFCGYALLGILFLRGFRNTPSTKKLKHLALISILASSLYGAGDEFHQSFVSSRTADLFDLLADIGGSITGVWTCHLFLNFLAKYRIDIPSK